MRDRVITMQESLPQTQFCIPKAVYQSQLSLIQDQAQFALREQEVEIQLVTQGDISDDLFSELTCIDAKKFAGKAQDFLVAYRTTKPVCFAGVGPKASARALRKCARQVAVKVTSFDVDSFSINFQRVFGDKPNNDAIVAFIQELLQSFYPRAQYKSAKIGTNDALRDRKEDKIYTIQFCVPGLAPADWKPIEEMARALAVGSTLACVMTDAPPNECSPSHMAKATRELFAQMENMQCTVYGEKECEHMRMGLFLSVGQGSNEEVQMIHLKYKKGSGSKKIALVGKGVTMDTGGYNLKTTKSIMTMKCDMAGAASVLGSALTIGLLAPDDVEVHFVAMCVENMISHKASRPGDIYWASNGKSVEVTNTDAEGRLALADGLHFAEKELGGPGSGTIIDIATLTGAALVALGSGVAACYSNDDKTVEEILKSAERSGEAIWRMPLEQDYKDNMKSKIADLRNSDWEPEGGSIKAGLFLEEFVDPKTPWVHIDAAGPLWSNNESRGTGFGVATMVNFCL